MLQPIAEERRVLQPLPLHRAADYTELSVMVSSSSTIEVRRVTYAIPSRLQGDHYMCICMTIV